MSVCEPAYVRQAIEREEVGRFNLGIGYSSGTRDDRRSMIGAKEERGSTIGVIRVRSE